MATIKNHLTETTSLQKRSPIHTNTPCVCICGWEICTPTTRERPHTQTMFRKIITLSYHAREQTHPHRTHKLANTKAVSIYAIPNITRQNTNMANEPTARDCGYDQHNFLADCVARSTPTRCTRGATEHTYTHMQKICLRLAFVHAETVRVRCLFV